MSKRLLKALHLLNFTLLNTLFISLAHAEVLSEDLSVITSANPESNSIQSFIIIEEGKFLKEGIKHTSKQQTISQQTPFVIDYTKPVTNKQTLQWIVKVNNKQHGSIKLLSDFKGDGRLFSSGYKWQSKPLSESIQDRHRLIFRPKPFSHQPEIYKKGKGPKGQRRKYGGGTKSIDEKKYNPKFEYHVTLNVIQNKKIISSHKAILSMDRKDMIRQEYINHYDIKRYGLGENGNIPVPRRDEIQEIPPKPEELEGNPLTESNYQLIINDGMLNLANKISQSYLTSLEKLKQSNSLVDLQQNKLDIPDSKLWITSGWRNPERNEWYSNAVNGIHQRGGAVDFIIMAPANSRASSIGYWILWNSLEENKHNIDAYWQLETNGRPMTTKEFTQDIEPKNGIPDAFDKADHLHANVNY